MNPILTPRLVLEPLAVDHADVVFPQLLDTRLYSYIPRDPPDSVGALRARFAELIAHVPGADNEHWLNWVGRLAEGDDCVGLFEATVYPGSHALIAYSVFMPFQRLGFGREGVEAVVNQVMTNYQLHRVIAEIDTRNRASISLVEALGFQLARHKLNADYFKGQTSHEFRYEISREEWVRRSEVAPPTK